MARTITVVDAFTAIPFRGNPAAVCILDGERPDAWMQDVAREMNLSETAFLLARKDGWSLRWFTPGGEVDLCGHATLASAHVLWEAEWLAPEETARFHSKSGPLSAARKGDWIELDFPALPAEPVADPPPALLEAIRAPVRFVGRSRFDTLIEVADETTVRNLDPDIEALNHLGDRGYMVTARAERSDAGHDFVSRFFAPAFGIPEDPVTGSAHCVLGPFWAERLGKTELVGYQCSARGGTVRVRLEGDRAFLGGQAVTVLRSELLED